MLRSLSRIESPLDPANVLGIEDEHFPAMRSAPVIGELVDHELIPGFNISTGDDVAFFNSERAFCRHPSKVPFIRSLNKIRGLKIQEICDAAFGSRSAVFHASLGNQIGSREKDEMRFVVEMIFVEEKVIVLFRNPLHVTSTKPDLVPHCFDHSWWFVPFYGLVFRLRIQIRIRVGHNSVQSGLH